MSSIDHLQTTFSLSQEWPRADLTPADALIDTQNEAGRFERRENFAYAVMTPGATRERGFVYIMPGAAGYDAVVRLWVTQADFDAGFDEELYAWTQDWVATNWPFAKVAYPGRAISWQDWGEMRHAEETQ